MEATNLRDDPILFDFTAIETARRPKKYSEQAVSAAASYITLTADTDKDGHDRWIHSQFDDDAYADFLELRVNPTDEVLAMVAEQSAQAQIAPVAVPTPPLAPSVPLPPLPPLLGPDGKTGSDAGARGTIPCYDSAEHGQRRKDRMRGRR